ncbi:phage tail assembly chaperone [Paenalcaligenes suwonensis]|uniref:phage tail assembly chaperone n=1 Tax=Paenalcaligenes suwonensis TaxID=1202713 RepID=UPI00140B5DEA|nr:phage tail assembly chaperone [Paenalcaligenes suwonensis]NHC62179.1 hypothetical protein [Paenalcaligenes suwonensis]
MSSFVVTKRPIVAFPISISVYDEKGELQEIEFVAQYKHASLTELQALQNGYNNFIRSIQGLDPVPDEKGKVQVWKYKTDMELVQERLVGWIGVSEESGQEMKLTKANLEKVIATYPELVKPLFHGFFSAHSGAKEKNS